jgi:MinD superfamily P-loop ATPase
MTIYRATLAETGDEQKVLCGACLDQAEDKCFTVSSERPQTDEENLTCERCGATRNFSGDW